MVSRPLLPLAAHALTVLACAAFSAFSTLTRAFSAAFAAAFAARSSCFSPARGRRKTGTRCGPQAWLETQMEKEAESYSDGLSIVEGIQKEFAQVIWPGPQEVVNTLGLVVAITAFMCLFVIGVDKFLQFALDPLFHYQGNQ